VGCGCPVCSSPARENRRTRSSVLVETEGVNILIDTSPDLRNQALREGFSQVNAVLYTHSHADHTNGIDDLKPFTRFGKNVIECYANPETAQNLRRNFSYIFGEETTEQRTPRLQLNKINGDFSIRGIEISPVKIKHGSWDILGYRIGRFAYLTDCNGIPSESVKKLENLDLLIMGALRHRPHIAHFNLKQTLEQIKTLCPERSVLTHMSCDMDYFELKKSLPDNVEPARDGAVFQIRNSGGETFD